MKAQLIVLFMLLSAICYGQTVSENDSLRFNKEKSEQLLNNNLQQGTHTLDRKKLLDDDTPFNKTVSDPNVMPDVPDMNITAPQVQVPLRNYLANPISNPFADDYKYDGYYKITGRDWISTTSLNTTYPSLGSLNLINVNYNYQFSDRMSGSAGAYGTRYFYLMNLNYDYGINSSLRYQVTDRFSIIAFGQYSAMGNSNKVGGDNGWMFPQTHYGVAAEFKFTDKVSIQGGMMRELNPMSGKWRNVPFIKPVFRLK